MPLILELEQAYAEAKADPAFKREMDGHLKHYVGRPSPLYFAERLTAHFGGAKIYLKREDLNHTGAHKVNNVLGQIMLAQAHGQAAHHRRDRRRHARRRDRDAVREVRPRMHRLHGRGRCRAAAAERAAHEDARRRGAAGRVRREDAQGRDERGAARLGHQRRRHVLLHRHGRGPASLSDDGARFPVRSSAARRASRCRRPKAGCRIR